MATPAADYGTTVLEVAGRRVNVQDALAGGCLPPDLPADAEVDVAAAALDAVFHHRLDVAVALDVVALTLCTQATGGAPPAAASTGAAADGSGGTQEAAPAATAASAAADPADPPLPSSLPPPSSADGPAELRARHGASFAALRAATGGGGSRSGVCGTVWRKDELAYKCRTCERDPTCAICVACFRAGDHSGHDYSIIRTGGGCCDCGDGQAWRISGFCSRHGGASGEADDPAGAAPPALRARIGAVASVVGDAAVAAVAEVVAATAAVATLTDAAAAASVAASVASAATVAGGRGRGRGRTGGEGVAPALRAGAPADGRAATAGRGDAAGGNVDGAHPQRPPPPSPAARADARRRLRGVRRRLATAEAMAVALLGWLRALVDTGDGVRRLVGVQLAAPGPVGSDRRRGPLGVPYTRGSGVPPHLAKAGPSWLGRMLAMDGGTSLTLGVAAQVHALYYQLITDLVFKRAFLTHFVAHYERFVVAALTARRGGRPGRDGGLLRGGTLAGVDPPGVAPEGQGAPHAGEGAATTAAAGATAAPAATAPAAAQVDGAPPPAAPGLRFAGPLGEFLPGVPHFPFPGGVGGELHGRNGAVVAVAAGGMLLAVGAATATGMTATTAAAAVAATAATAAAAVGAARTINAHGHGHGHGHGAGGFSPPSPGDAHADALLAPMSDSEDGDEEEAVAGAGSVPDPQGRAAPAAVGDGNDGGADGAAMLLDSAAGERADTDMAGDSDEDVDEEDASEDIGDSSTTRSSVDYNAGIPSESDDDDSFVDHDDPDDVDGAPLGFMLPAFVEDGEDIEGAFVDVVGAADVAGAAMLLNGALGGVGAGVDDGGGGGGVGGGGAGGGGGSPVDVDDGERRGDILESFSVQLFTVPALVPDMLRPGGLLHVLVRVLGVLFRSAATGASATAKVMEPLPELTLSALNGEREGIVPEGETVPSGGIDDGGRVDAAGSALNVAEIVAMDATDADDGSSSTRDRERGTPSGGDGGGGVGGGADTDDELDHVELGDWTIDVIDETEWSGEVIWRVMYDLRYVLTHVEVSAAVVHGRGALFRSLIALLGKFQSMNAVVRRLGMHVERDSDAWVPAFSMELDVSLLVDLLAAGFTAKPVEPPTSGDDPEAAAAALYASRCAAIAVVRSELGRYLARSSSARNGCSGGGSGSSGGAPTRVSKDRVSVHLPLHRLLALFAHHLLRLHSSPVGGGEGAAGAVAPPPVQVTAARALGGDRDVNPAEALAIGEAVACALSLLAQVRAGMWVRNGRAVQGSAVLYRSVFCADWFVDLDVFLLQLVAAVSGGEAFEKLLRRAFEIDGPPAAVKEVETPPRSAGSAAMVGSPCRGAGGSATPSDPSRGGAPPAGVAAAPPTAGAVAAAPPRVDGPPGTVAAPPPLGRGDPAERPAGGVPAAPATGTLPNLAALSSEVRSFVLSTLTDDVSERVREAAEFELQRLMLTRRLEAQLAELNRRRETLMATLWAARRADFEANTRELSDLQARLAVVQSAGLAGAAAVAPAAVSTGVASPASAATSPPSAAAAARTRATQAAVAELYAEAATTRRRLDVVDADHARRLQWTAQALAEQQEHLQSRQERIIGLLRRHESWLLEVVPAHWAGTAATAAAATATAAAEAPLARDRRRMRQELLTLLEPPFGPPAPNPAEGLIVAISPEPTAPIAGEYTTSVLSDYLALLAQVVGERARAGFPASDLLKRKVLTRLAVADQTHSQLLRACPRRLLHARPPSRASHATAAAASGADPDGSDGAGSASPPEGRGWEEEPAGGGPELVLAALRSVAAFTQPREMEQGRYRLIPSAWSLFDPFTPHLTARERTAAEQRRAAVRMRSRQPPSLIPDEVVADRPVLPPLAPLVASVAAAAVADTAPAGVVLIRAGTGLAAGAAGLEEALAAAVHLLVVAAEAGGDGGGLYAALAPPAGRSHRVLAAAVSLVAEGGEAFREHRSGLLRALAAIRRAAGPAVRTYICERLPRLFRSPSPSEGGSGGGAEVRAFAGSKRSVEQTSTGGSTDEPAAAGRGGGGSDFGGGGGSNGGGPGGWPPGAGRPGWDAAAARSPSPAPMGDRSDGAAAGAGGGSSDAEEVAARTARRSAMKLRQAEAMKRMRAQRRRRRQWGRPRA